MVQRRGRRPRTEARELGAGTRFQPRNPESDIGSEIRRRRPNRQEQKIHFGSVFDMDFPCGLPNNGSEIAREGVFR